MSQNDQTLQRRRSSWRSEKLNELIDALDARMKKSNSKHSKKQRVE